MKVSYKWLQNYFEEKLPEPEKIAEGIIFHSFEIESFDRFEGLTAGKLGTGDKVDWIFDIKILPDRAHDCLSHWGIAKEVSAIFNLPIKKVEIPKEENLPNSDLKIEIKNNKCRRYVGRIVRDVSVGPSPAWLKESLETIGQKSINNIVDATNYVMFDLGNPIHAFDLAKLSGHKIIVDNAKKGEKITLLDGKEIELDEEVLTIRDEKNPLAIAGIKGGQIAEINQNTKDIVIEVANFDPVLIRKTARKLNIDTDSAKRFENEIHPKLAIIAMEKITKLILEVAGGESLAVVDIYLTKLPEDRKISLEINYLNKLLGLSLTNNQIEDALRKLNFQYETKENEIEINIPFTRLDILGPHDLVEEIGRIHGYDKIDQILPEIKSKEENDSTWIKISLAKQKLVNDGYKEVMTYAFRNKGDVEILAGLSDKRFLRTNLTDGLKESIKLNKVNLPLLETDKVKIFEIGTVFTKNGSTSAEGYGETKEEIHVAYGDEKNITEVILDKFASEKLSFPEHGYFSAEKFLELAPSRSLGSEKETFHTQTFKSWSIYPFITRDIAVWVPEGTKSEELSKIYKEFGTELLIKEPKLFDQFTKEGKTSYAFRLVFQSFDRTLTDEEVGKIMQVIEEEIKKLNWQVR
jgi:phenylalanyl-tRNA synthetase beta chain